MRVRKLDSHRRKKGWGHSNHSTGGVMRQGVTNERPQIITQNEARHIWQFIHRHN